jgi:hypothetical protein
VLPTYSLRLAGSLQHPLQILTQHALYFRNPPLRLTLHHLIIILPQLADKRQHLGQQAEPLLAQALRKTLLAQHSREPCVRLLVAHVLEQHGVHLAVVIEAACAGGGELGDGGDDVGGYSGGVGEGKQVEQWRHDGAVVRGGLPEAVLIVSE